MGKCLPSVDKENNLDSKKLLDISKIERFIFSGTLSVFIKFPPGKSLWKQIIQIKIEDQRRFAVWFDSLKLECKIQEPDLLAN